MSAVMAMEPPAEARVTTAQLSRLEGFGDNCELGFVLRRFGFEDGMLFRWASIPPENLLATLRGDFEAMYAFDQLVPQNSKMVRDLRYGASWHTQMSSSRRAGILTFDADGERRQAIHAREAFKFAYLVEKLRRKFMHPNPVFVIKANAGIADDVLEAIHYQIYRRATSSRFLLLDVREDTGRAGRVELLDRNRMRGYVSRFAPYERSYDGDDAGWLAVLAVALAHYDAAPNETTVSLAVNAAPQAVILPFPTGSGPNLLACVPGDLRGGMASRIGGNEWCRLVDNDIYRLHATGLNEAATALRWTGVHLPPGCVLKVRAGYAIEESLPVRMTLEIIGADGTTLCSQRIFDAPDERELSLTGPPSLPNPLTVGLYAEPLVPLKTGERAVIDIAPVSAVPSAAQGPVDFLGPADSVTNCEA